MARAPKTAPTAQGSLKLNLNEHDNERLANLCGPLEQNLRAIEVAFDLTIRRRGAIFELIGLPERQEAARLMLLALHDRSASPVSIDDVQLAIVESTSNHHAGAAPADSAEGPVLRTRRTDLRGRTPRQRDYLRQILGNDICFGVGPAGTGKTYLAVACAVDALERDLVQRIVLTRPAVEAGERLGFLPGDLAQKVDPYLRPLYDALYDLVGFDKVAKLFERQAIEIAPLAYMRGRTLNHAFVILDEAQNTTPEQMKMFLTRIGFGSKAVVTGDPSQIDLPKGQRSGLIDAQEVLAQVRGIATTQFSSLDVVRHPLVARIVDAYEQHALN